MSKSLEERLKELEKGYENMPDFVSSDNIIKRVEKANKRSPWKRIYVTAGSVLAAGIAAVLVMSQPGIAPGDGNNKGVPGEAPEEDQKENSTEDSVPELSERQAAAFLNEWETSFLSLVDEADSDQKIDSYETTGEVQQYFEETMSQELAAWMTDAYFTNRDDGVYVIAKDGPTWFEESQPFEMEKESDTRFLVTQERNNELLGHVNMIYHLVYQDGQWVVHEIESEEANSSNRGANVIPDELSGPQQAALNQADTILQQLLSQDAERLASRVHPDKGLLFSPYVHIEEERAVVLEKNQVANFFTDDNVYEWGVYDGSGHSIEATPAAYYEEFIYHPDLSSPDEIVVGETKQRGNMQSNIREVFPEAAVVEYHVESEEEGGMDWKSVNIVLEQDEQGSWFVTAIVTNEWTI
ncbi:hypothetical protein SAMN05192534_10115 [Alteribacillus persepolensis]|uniref:Uncharacterized protein n=1 Tax=Alteribacillus persepolensis TaxID=568899 RepID=A0A1G7Y6P0_9BACI|nr:hypothetical protein [Alteribacillus persepolensis]SDG92132.1 hypothetical protein SAMN05192534_10115 [Alteribacillus persepolensis]